MGIVYYCVIFVVGKLMTLLTTIFSFCFVLLLLFVGVACLYGLIQSALVGRSAPSPGTVLDSCMVNCGCLPSWNRTSGETGVELDNVTVSGSDPVSDDGPQCDVVSYISLFTNCCCYGVCIGT